jgi:hypothetical protein|tara:strand:- start:300 stop:1055 length:756 start_codon:yes stop_codon:yes gene_type:complete
MKKSLFTFFTVLIFNVIFSQNSNKLFVYNFYNVNDGRIESYENVMKNFISGINKKLIDDGCKDSWIFRKVDPTTEMSNYISHYTIDVYNDGQQPCDVDWGKESIPGLPKELFDELMNIHQKNRKRIFVSRLGEVAGYNKEDRPAEYSVVNFMRVNNISKYSKKLKESTKGIFEKHSNRQLWAANNRLNLEGYAADEWNFITVDGYYSKSDAMKSTNIPQKVITESNKKYGLNNKMRTINKRMLSSLIMYLN